MLFLSACVAALPKEEVNFYRTYTQELSSRGKPAKITEQRPVELKKQGYSEIGTIEVTYETKRCFDKCEEYSHSDDLALRLLKEAAQKGGDLVFLTSINQSSSEEVTKRGLCASWKTVWAHELQPDGSLRLVTREQCERYNEIPGTSYLISSRGSVWRKDPNLVGVEIIPDRKPDPADSEGLTVAVAERSFYSDTAYWGYVDKTGKFAIPPRFSSVEEFSEGLARVKEYLWDMSVSDWGYIDKIGKFVIAPKLYDADNFSEGLARVKVRKHGKWGYIDKTGKFVTGLAFYDAKNFSKGLARVQPNKDGEWGYINKTGMWGYIDKTGKFVAKDDPSVDVEVSEEEKYGFIDKTGKFVIEPTFYRASSFFEGLAKVVKDGKWGYIDKTGKFVIGPKFYDAENFSEGLAPAKVSKDGKWGYIDKTGNFVIEPRFFLAFLFSEGLACVKINSEYSLSGYIDKTGKVVIEPGFEFAKDYSEGLAHVKRKKDNMRGYIDKTGKFVIKKAVGRSFSEGLAGTVHRVSGQIKWGYIDKTGKVVIEPKFYNAYNFSEGLARVQMYTGWPPKSGYIDKTGKFVIEQRFITAENFSEELALVKVITYSK